MRKKLVAAALALSCVVVSAGTTFAADPVGCNGLNVYSVGTGSPLSTDIFVNLIPDVACGAWAAGVKKQFVLDTTNTDQTLAAILTAYSLGQKLWIKADITVANPPLLGMSMHK